MNAQQIIDTCNIRKQSRTEFRNEMNLNWLINDVKKQFMISGNGEGGQNSSSDSPCPSINREGGIYGN